MSDPSTGSGPKAGQSEDGSADRRDAGPTDGVRLQKVLANAGVASRRVAENLIVEGRVRVNGEVVTELGSRIDPEVDLVDVDGTAIQLDETKRYVVLNKPRGVVSSMLDDRGRPDLRQFVEDWPERLYNVGRLDADTSGLLVLTNDGELAHVLAHPSFGVTKVYVAKVEGRVTAADDRDAHARDRARGRSDRGRQGAAAVCFDELGDRRARRGVARRADPALRPQPHRAAHDGRRRASGRRARAAPVRPAAPGNPPSGAGTRVD